MALLIRCTTEYKLKCSGVLILNESLLIQLLPDNGDPISLSAVCTALSIKLGRSVTESDVDHLIWKIGPRVSLDPVRSEVKVVIPDYLPKIINNERDLEGWFERYLRREAANQYFLHKPPSLSFIVQNTARTGAQSGAYSKPDICMACVSQYHYSPITHFDLFCFELKMGYECGPKPIMQAKAYTDIAHYSYVGIYIPDDSVYKKNLSRMREVAQDQGIGIVLITDPFLDEGYEVIVRASRHSPRLGKIDHFIEERFSDSHKHTLRNWVRP